MIFVIHVNRENMNLYKQLLKSYQQFLDIRKNVDIFPYIMVNYPCEYLHILRRNR